MTIFRGEGGGGDATTDSEINLITSLTNSITADKAITLAAADSATASANAAAASEAGVTASAASAVTAASNAASSESNANASALNASISASASLTSANASASSAAASLTSANASAASAASASAIVLGVASGLPSIRPTLNLDFANSDVIDPRITFTRASTATYYDGKTTAKAEENLLVRSQEFDNVSWWVQNAISITANSTTAPDNTTTAETVIENSTLDAHVPYQNSTLALTTVYTLSVFMKANTRNFGMVRVGGGAFAAGPAIKVDLTNGTVTNIDGTVISSSATSVGNGWYRCILTFTSGSFAGHTPQFGPHDNGSTVTYTGNGTGSVYAWGAQLEQRSSVTAYTPTTTQAITNYIPVLQTAASGVARLDHDPVTFAAKGLLIEEARTNLLTYSSTFNNAAWTTSLSTVTANVTTSPDGTVNSFSISKSAAFGNIRQQVTATNGNYAASVYVKAGTENNASFGVTENGTATLLIRGSVNLTTGVVTNNSGTFTATSVGNGWWKLTGACTTTTGTNISLLVYPGIYSGTEAGTVYIWGAQLEAGAFATSYIPTTTAQATRAADSASMIGTNFSSWYNASEGSLFTNGTLVGATPSTYPYMTALVGANANNDSIGLQWTASSGALRFGVRSGAVAQADIPNGANKFSGSSFKMAGAYAANYFQAATDGVISAVDTSGSVPTVVALSFGGAVGFQPVANIYINQVTYYPKRISNTELQALTA